METKLTEKLLTESECKSRAAKLQYDGWDIIPVEEPEKGTCGFICSRYIGHDGFVVEPSDMKNMSQNEWDEIDEECEYLKWPVFGTEFEPEITITKNAKEMVEFIKSDPSVQLCDNAKQLRMGFVSYDKESGKAKILQMNIAQIKKARDTEAGQYILDIGWKMRKEQKERRAKDFEELYHTPIE